MVQTLVDEERESAEIVLGVGMSEVQFQIVRAAYVVLVGAQMATMKAAKAPTSARAATAEAEAAEAATAEAAKASTRPSVTGEEF